MSPPDSSRVLPPATEPTDAAGATPPMTVFKPDEVTALLRKVSRRLPGSKTGLDRDTACAVLTMLEDLQRRRRWIPKYVFCPYCRQSFDSEDNHVHPGGPDRPPRHPDPIAASDTSAGAEAAAAAMADAVEVKAPLRLADDLNDPHDFWMAHGRLVLWPLLYAARATGRTMDDVRKWTDPDHVIETLIAVRAALRSIAATPDAERARRQWQAMADSDVRFRRAAFGIAHGQVLYWQATGRDTILGPAPPTEARGAGTTSGDENVGAGAEAAS